MMRELKVPNATDCILTAYVAAEIPMMRELKVSPNENLRETLVLLQRKSL